MIYILNRNKIATDTETEGEIHICINENEIETNRDTLNRVIE